MAIWTYRLTFVGPSKRPKGKSPAASLLLALSLLLAAVPVASVLAQTAVTGLVATLVSSDQIDLSWPALTASPSPAGIEILRCQGTGCDPGSAPILITLAATARTYSDNLLSFGATYRYKVQVRATDGGVSEFFNIVDATTPLGPTPTAVVGPPFVSPIGSSAGLTASVNVEQAFVSVTVGLASLVFGSTASNPTSCMDRNGSSTNGLLAPNGTCDASDQSIEVRVQSNVPSNILVKGSNAVPISGNPGWALCQATGVDAPNPSPCAGTLPSSNFPSTTMPGTDQYRMLLGPLALTTQQALTDTFQCDTNVHVTDCNTPLGPQPLPGNGLPPLTVAAEYARIIGPQTSTDPATIFTTSITWLASQ